MLKEKETIFNNYLRFADCSAIFIAWLASYLFRFHFLPNAQRGLFDDYLHIGIALTLTSLYFFDKNGLYKSQHFQNKYREFFSLLRANTFVFIALIFFLYFFKFEKFSRIQLLVYYSSSLILLTSERLIIRNIRRNLRSKGRNFRNILLIGNGKQLEEYVKTARAFKDSGLRFVAWRDNKSKADEYEIESIDEQLSDPTFLEKIDVIVLSYTPEDSAKSFEFIKKNHDGIRPIQVLPDLSYSLIGHQIEDFEGIPLLTVNQPNFSSIDLFLKRALDLSITFLGLLIISPCLFLIALGVKLSSSGPIFYGQERVGLNGKKFKMWKFRSMRTAENQEDKTSWSSENDPRKTKFGSFIRKTSIDELPQLWNVVWGDMSLVGPRPERPYFVDKFREEIPSYMLRHKMKAGITGWAQINGWRGDTSIAKRIECDIYYIKNWSFLLDLKIIFLTFIKGFINKNAY